MTVTDLWFAVDKVGGKFAIPRELMTNFYKDIESESYQLI